MKLKRKRAAVMQYLIQAVFLVLFLVLTFSLGAGVLPADLIARLDPLMAAALPIVNRTWMSEVIPGLVILASALLLGRIFCGYACPMGTTLDIVRAAFRAMLYPFRRRPKADAALNADLPGPQNAAKQDAAPAKAANFNPDDDNVVTRGWFQLKYMALAIILVTALLGVNTLVWGAPLLLITRFLPSFAGAGPAHGRAVGAGEHCSVAGRHGLGLCGFCPAFLFRLHLSGGLFRGAVYSGTGPAALLVPLFLSGRSLAGSFGACGPLAAASEKMRVLRRLRQNLSYSGHFR